MLYREFIEKMRTLSCYCETAPSHEVLTDAFKGFDVQDPEFVNLVEAYAYEELPKIPVLHKEQGFELRLLQTCDDFNSEIHDHPMREVYGVVLKGKIDMAVFDLKKDLQGDAKQLLEKSHETYKASDYFYIGKSKNNFHHIKANECSTVLELILPAITAKHAESALKYKVEKTVDPKTYEVSILEEPEA